MEFVFLVWLDLLGSVASHGKELHPGFPSPSCFCAFGLRLLLLTLRSNGGMASRPHVRTCPRIETRSPWSGSPHRLLVKRHAHLPLLLSFSGLMLLR